ncbi:hypothetical protein [Planctomyces sp. SH-PL14]|uniref:hypothetical protein n=1 Tax=Planctomyces sp. SH-PL14 TaxID=1632864 RepID=UPI0009462DD3|nr:hypothetical protein [Planctomyces sp. SH-PL14]
MDFRDQLASEATLPAAGTEIRAAITRVLAAQSDVSNEQLYDTVYAELNGAEPLLAPHLLCFIDQFCIRLRDVLREIAAASIASEDAAKPESEKNTPYVRSVTTPYFASQFPAQAIERLDAFAALQVSDPSAARIFALSHFAGCADSEIADLLELRAGAVRISRISAVSLVCGEHHSDEDAFSPAQ